MPFFSVIVPTYNQAAYLRQALDSVLAQTDPDWEAVVVNDGSTDETVQVLEQFAARDARFIIIHKENGGVGSALNEGLRQANGEWVCWLSSDDLFEPDKLSINRRWIANHPAGRFFYSYFYTLYEATGEKENGRLWGTELPAPEWQVLGLLHHNYINGISVCIQREAWLEVGNFNEALRYGQDYDMWLRLMSHYPSVFIPEWTCISRYHADQASSLFQEACFYDSAKSAIDFINTRSFVSWFPMLDLSDLKGALGAAKQILHIAADSNAFIYRLGLHAGLLLRLLDWAYDGFTNKPLWNYCRRWIMKQIRKYPHQPESLYWKMANAVAELKTDQLAFSPIPAVSLAENYYHYCRAAGDAAADSLYDYLKQFEDIVPLKSPVRLPQREIILLTPPELSLGDEHPAMTACLKAAGELLHTGAQVLLVGRADQLAGYLENVPYLGLPDECNPGRVLTLLQPVDTLIAVGYPDRHENIAARHILAFTTQTACDEVFYEHVLGAIRNPGPRAPFPFAIRLVLLWGRLERLVENEIPGRLHRFRLRFNDAVRRRLKTLDHWWNRRS